MPRHVMRPHVTLSGDLDGPGSEASRRRIQRLLMEHLLLDGEIELHMPDGLLVRLSTCQEDGEGKRIPVEGYASVTATMSGRGVELDTYTVGLNYRHNPDHLLLVEDERVIDDRDEIRRVYLVS